MNLICFKFIFYLIDQLIGAIPLEIRKAFVFEKGLLPKKPLYAENGEGCGASII